MNNLRKLAVTVLLAVTSTVSYSQVLVKTYTMSSEEAPFFCDDNGITYSNKPNGLIYRLRVEVPFPDLPRTEEVADKELFITDRTDDGYVALFRNPTSADDYSFYVLTYNKKKKVTGVYDLCKLSETYNCEVQDIRWFDGHLYFNMACPSYSSGVGGRGSKLFSLNLETGTIDWSTQYLVSNDVFAVDEDYVYCAYGFTDEPDYVFLIDRRYGITRTKCPIKSKSQYIEIVGPHQIYVQDYNDNGYLFEVQEKGVRVTGNGVRLRMGPTTSSDILKNDNGHTVYPMKDDVLPSWGDAGEFNKVIYNRNNYVYISRMYSTTDVMPHYDSCDRPWAGIRAWLGADDDIINFEIYDMAKFCEAVGMSEDNCELTPGVHQVAIDSPLACGVYIDMCFHSLGLYAMSEDCRAFCVNLSQVARGAYLESFEFPHYFMTDEEDEMYCVSGFQSVSDEDYSGEITVVFAEGFDGLKSRCILDPDYYYLDGEDEDYEDYEDDPFVPFEGPQTSFSISGALVDEKGKANDIRLEIETEVSGIAAGTIVYHPEKKNESRIRLFGDVSQAWDWESDDEEDTHYRIDFTEYLDDGTRCGSMSLDLLNGTITGGTWTMDEKSYTVRCDSQSRTDLEESILLKHLDADALDGKYGWTQKFAGSDLEYAGELTCAKESADEISFSVCNVMPNIAQAEGVATKDGDSFYWYHEDCGVLYYINVFKDAVYITHPEFDYDGDCYGMGASIKGWYPRIRE